MTGDTLAPLVHAAAVSRSFGRGRTAVVAVHGATCTVYAGDRIAVVGPSGSGKSTLLHLLAGLDRPTVGSVSWPALGAHPLECRAGTIGLIFQGPSLLPDLDVTENVALPLLIAGLPDADAMAQASTALAELNLDSLGGQLPDELSGGQAQRVAIARALAGRPRLILADEPTGQLDHESAADVVSLLLTTAERLVAGLVISTHDPAVASRLPDRWTMLDGRPNLSQTVPC